MDSRQQVKEETPYIVIPSIISSAPGLFECGEKELVKKLGRPGKLTSVLNMTFRANEPVENVPNPHYMVFTMEDGAREQFLFQWDYTEASPKGIENVRIFRLDPNYDYSEKQRQAEEETPYHVIGPTKSPVPGDRISSAPGLFECGEKELVKKLGRPGKLTSVLNMEFSKGEPVENVPNPHYMVFTMEDGTQEQFLFKWDCTEKHPKGIENVRIFRLDPNYDYAEKQRQVNNNFMNSQSRKLLLPQSASEMWERLIELRKMRNPEEERYRRERWEWENPESSRKVKEVIERGRKRREERERREKEMENEEYVPCTKFVEDPPKPDKPLVLENGAKPKVGLFVLSDFHSWDREYIHWERVKLNAPPPLAHLIQRVNYLHQLFEGCDVELIFVGECMAGTEDEITREHLGKIEGAVVFDSDETLDVYGRLLKSKYDFGLMMNIRRNGADAGMGYGLEEVRERLFLRGLGLASGGNYLFGDWGYPGDQGRGMNDWTDLEFAAAHDSSGYMHHDLKAQLYKFARKSPTHSRPISPLIRLGHFIRPMSHEEMKLRDEDIERIWSAARGEHFSKANLLATWWCTFNGLLFAGDFVESPFYRWKWKPIQSVQSWFAKKWLDWQFFYWNSFELEWAELVLEMYGKAKRFLKNMLLSVFVIAVACIVAHIGYDSYW